VPGPGSPEGRRPTVFIKHWCHACGRVASEKYFGKDQSKASVSRPGDIRLGSRTMNFRLHSHDPRQMSKFAGNWAENKGKLEWTYNEHEMEEELFRHRFGKRPTLSTILASIPVVAPDQIPKDGEGWGASCLRDKMASASETQAILLDDPNDTVVLQEIQRNACTFGDGARTYHHDHLSGDITAHWDSHQRKGVSILLQMLILLLRILIFTSAQYNKELSRSYLTILSPLSHFVIRPLRSECSWRATILIVLRT
jgi:hypothetical protein